MIIIPIEGQSFSCKTNWINSGKRRLTSHHDYLNTEHGERMGWRGFHFTAMCFDQNGMRCRQGSDFDKAEYPVWWVWPDQISDMIMGFSELGERKPTK